MNIIEAKLADNAHGDNKGRLRALDLSLAKLKLRRKHLIV